MHQSEKELTEPQPFHLRSLERHERYQQEFQQKVEDEFEKENQMFSSFRARDPVHLKHEAFVPAPSNHEPVVPDNVVLNTEARVQRRHEFEQTLAEQRKTAYEASVRRQQEKEVRFSLPSYPCCCRNVVLFTFVECSPI